MRKLLVIVATCAALVAQAGNIQFSYVGIGDKADRIGTSQAKPYDVAIRLNGSDFAGAKIAAMSVPVPASDNVTNFKVWVSNSLALNGQVNAPDVFEGAAQPSNGVLQYTFNPPIEVGSGDIYVGYSFEVTKVDDVTDEPVITVSGKKPGALYVHGGAIWRKWTDVGNTYSQISRMTVTLTGDYTEADLALGLADTQIATGIDRAELNVPVTITNYGTYGAKSVDVAYSFNGGTPQVISMQLSPEQTMYMAGNTYTLTIPNKANLGDNTLDITIARANGVANVNADKSADVAVLSLKEMPVYRPLFEEYTGLWCGYCPRGLAAMEYMSHKYPDQWVGVALHDGDAMTILSGSQFPNSIGSFPSAVIDRVQIVDPYYGVGEDYSRTIEDDWLDWCKEFTPFIVSVNASYDANDPKVVNAQASVKTVMPLEGDYRLFYYLVADGVHNDVFVQNNGYAGTNPASYAFPEMRQFCEGDGYMTGLKFNDIPVMASDLKGIQGSLPGTLASNTDYTHSYTFNTTGAKSLRGYDMIGSASQLNVVVGVVDYATGKVMNSAKCKVGAAGGVSSITADRQIVSQQVYDLTGRPVVVGTPGLKIVRTVYSDGTVETTKTR